MKFQNIERKSNHPLLNPVQNRNINTNLLIHNNRPHWATVCKICGKIGDLHFFEIEKTEQGYYRSLDFDEVYEKYMDLENIVIEDIWQKYVPISREGGELNELLYQRFALKLHKQIRRSYIRPR